MEIFGALNGNARLVGGAVRDALMNVQAGDIDFATPYDPAQIVALLEKKGIRTIPTGIKHGTVSALVNDTLYEITTLRRDEKTDGRHAEVAFTDSYEEDARRRDFTINALYLDANGHLYDYTGGQEDIKNKHVRFIGNADERICEDYLRLLRYFRFWGKMGHRHIDEEARQACMRQAEGLNQISKERKRDELFKILMQNGAPITLRFMEQTGVLSYLVHRADIQGLEKFLAVNAQAPLLQRLSILTGKCLPDLALSNVQKQTLELYGETADLNAPLKNIKELLYLKGLDAFQFYIKRALSLKQITPQQAKEYAALTLPVFPLTGGDLLAAGYKEGPQMKELFMLAKSIWADLDFTDNKILVLKALMAYNKK